MNKFTRFLVDNAPSILTGVGIANWALATLFGIIESPDARDEIRSEEETRVLSTMDKIKIAAPHFIPTLVTASVGTGCIVAANNIHIDRNTAAIAACAISEAAFKEYAAKTKEIIGEKKEKVIREEVAKDVMEKHPYSGREAYLTGNGDVLCYDKNSDRYFKSDKETLLQKENRLNRRLLEEAVITQNDLYLEIGLNPVELGNDLGWKIDDGLIKMRFDCQLTDTGVPCLVMDFELEPKYIH